MAKKEWMIIQEFTTGNHMQYEGEFDESNTKSVLKHNTQFAHMLYAQRIYGENYLYVEYMVYDQNKQLFLKYNDYGTLLEFFGYVKKE